MGTTILEFEKQKYPKIIKIYLLYLLIVILGIVFMFNSIEGLFSPLLGRIGYFMLLGAMIALIITRDIVDSQSRKWKKRVGSDLEEHF